MLITLPPLDRPYQSHVCLFFVTILFIGYQNDHAKFLFFFVMLMILIKVRAKNRPLFSPKFFIDVISRIYRQFSRIIKFQKKQQHDNSVNLEIFLFAQSLNLVYVQSRHIEI